MMHPTRLKRPIATALFTAAWIASVVVARADPVTNFNPFLSREPAAKISATVSESVDQVVASSHLALQDTQLLLSKLASQAGRVVNSALDLTGIRYRWGGNTPKKGFDCSGFVRYVFQNTLGLTLPRRADEMSRVGDKITVDELKPGDLVFFNTRRRTFSHVGIFIGNRQFIHSPSTGHSVRVDSLDNRYWERHFTGARRLEPLGQMPSAAEIEPSDTLWTEASYFSSETEAHLTHR